MGDELIRVEAYAGGKGAEKPVAFFVDEERVEVADIVWRHSASPTMTRR